MIAKAVWNILILPDFAIKGIATFIEAFLGMETWSWDIFEV